MIERFEGRKGTTVHRFELHRSQKLLWWTTLAVGEAPFHLDYHVLKLYAVPEKRGALELRVGYGGFEYDISYEVVRLPPEVLEL